MMHKKNYPSGKTAKTKDQEGPFGKGFKKSVLVACEINTSSGDETGTGKNRTPGKSPQLWRNMVR